MSLRTKFNLAALITFLIGFVITGFLLNSHFEQSARADALQTARVMMSAANAVRHYTTTTIRPLIGIEQDGAFLAASVPSFAAQTNFRQIATDFGEYLYKEAALNPTNPADRATDWEADMINEFRGRAGAIEIISERATPIGQLLSLARPIAVSDESCLTCHSTAAAAPASMTAQYGEANGFGWQLGEVIGAQVVTLPVAPLIDKARGNLLVFLALLTGVFLLMLLILNVLLHFLVIRPVTTMSRLATEVSLGNLDAADFAAGGKDEISTLGAAFNRMRRSLQSAMRMLDDGDEK